VIKRINPHGKPYDHLDRIQGWKTGQKPSPATLEWDLSNRCPYGCLDCHFAHTHTKGPFTRDARIFPLHHDKGGDLADTPSVMRVLLEARTAGVESIVWTGGGEPTTHPDCFSIWGNAHYLGYKQGLYTLGALLNPSQVRFIREHFSWIVISLDAYTPEGYAREKRTPESNFAKACAVISALSGGPCDVGVSFLLHEQNFMQIPDMVDLSRSLGATYTTLRPTIRTAPNAPGVPIGDRSWVHQALPLLERWAQEPDVEADPHRFWQWATWTTHPYSTCHGIKLNATITPDLRMWVCPNRREYGGHSLIGNLHTHSFAEVWANHPGHLQVDKDCRAMCRLNPVNETLAVVFETRPHKEFI
jgi:sulfatase maturation enzyme AslB (radical SAM superfamily)